MQMINQSEHTVRIPSEFLDEEAWKGEGTKPPYVAIPPGMVVAIHDSYALRRSNDASHRDAGYRKSAIEGQAPQLKPFGAEANKRYASMTVDDLDFVKRAFAELEKAGKPGTGTISEQMIQAEAQKAFHAGYAAALGIDKPKPIAEPVFVVPPSPPSPSSDEAK